MKIPKQQYWEQLINFFYDESWGGGHNTIYDWLESEYGARSTTGDPYLTFKSPKHATLFRLRWSDTNIA